MLAQWHGTLAAAAHTACLAAGRHLLESTVVAGLMALICVALRRRSASARHAAWLIAGAKFAVPMALLGASGAKLAGLIRPGQLPFLEISGLSRLLSPAIAPVEPTSQGPQHLEIYCVLAGLWLLGTVISIAVWARRLLTGFGPSAPAPPAGQRVLERVKKTLAVTRQVALRISWSVDQPGLWGIWKPALVLPERLAEQLDPAEFEAVLLHEVAHARRRDNLVGCMMHLVACMFWFYPLVWWIELQVLREREHACDELVVRSGTAPEHYASGILKVCQFHFAGPVAGVSGVTGSNLKKRIELIMSNSAGNSISRASKTLLGTLAAALVLVPFGMGFLHRAALHAQTLEKRKGAEFVGAQVLNFSGKTTDHTKTMAALTLLFSSYMDIASNFGEPGELGQPYRLWLNRDVPYIITPEERSAFIALASDEEREHFIVQFWQRRNPAPETQENAFKEEHYRRIKYADERFRKPGLEGWQTDRGRLYIVMGPLDELEQHPDAGREMWMYHKLDGTADNLIVTFNTKLE